MKNKLFVMIITLITIVTIGCTNTLDKNTELPNEQKPPVKNDIKDSDDIKDREELKDDKEIVEEFNSLIQNDSKLDKIISFIDENIGSVSEENASMMITDLEKLQKTHLKQLEEKFASDDILQTKLMDVEDIEKSVFDMDKINKIEDEELKNMIIEIRNQGYMIDSSEGIYFPIISYEFYKRYTDYVTEDIKGYIDILAKESNEPPADDAALAISWKEIVERALEQEKFTLEYPEAITVTDIEELYGNYRMFIFRGLNNTPLFDYDTKIIDNDAKEAYMEIVDKDKDSELLSEIKDFLNVLKKNDYKSTDEVEKFIEEKGV